MQDWVGEAVPGAEEGRGRGNAVSFADPRFWNVSANHSGYQQSADTATWLAIFVFVFGCIFFFLLHFHATACQFLNTAVWGKIVWCILFLGKKTNRKVIKILALILPFTKSRN